MKNMLNVLSKMKYITLNGAEKIQMPLVGLGTWRAQPEEIEKVVLTALENGYRHIDTAFNYNNEDAIGNALKTWFETGNGKREDLFITTKLPHVGNRANDVERFLQMSLEKLQLSYIDLYLIHMPFSFVCDKNNYTPVINEDGTFALDINNNIETWKVMEKQVSRGQVKAIGLSNFNAQQLTEIYKCATIKPSVLQIELHAYLQQKDLRQVCKDLNVAVTAYAPLGSPGVTNHFAHKYNYVMNDSPNILENAIVTDLSKQYKKTPGQILLRHLIQQEIIVIPKSGHEQRLKDNIDILDFELSTDDMEKLNSLDQGEQGRIFNFLFFKGVEKHPEYPFELQL